ncbi:hypothetical protein KKA53_02890 [Candidatus Dependentiae bacterium]|nr:hypothetical protein [Candidatus Dependentiae bacterium]
MFRRNQSPYSPYNNILGWILTILGAVILFFALGEFLFRLAIAALGIYLLYNGLKLRNQHHHITILFNRFGGQFRRW